MNLSNPEIDKELNCYKRIIECFLKSKNDLNRKKMSKSQIIIKLMKILQQTNDKAYVGNALVLVLSLFDGECQTDLYSNIGNDIETCDNKEKKVLISELKEVFL